MLNVQDVQSVIDHDPEIFASRRWWLGRLSLAAIVALAPGLALAGAYEDYFHAAKMDDAKVIKSLLARGFDPNTIEPERGDTGMILGLRENSMRVFEVLLYAPGVNVNARARNGDTALMIAAYKGNRRAIDALLDKGAEVNKPGWTALHYAAYIGDNEIVKRLLGHSAYIDAQSPNKTTPLMMAAWAGHAGTTRLLLDAGADASLKNERGMTAIDFAMEHNHRDIADGLRQRLQKTTKR